MAPPALTDAEILTHLQDMLQIQQQLTTVVQALAQPQEKADNNEEEHSRPSVPGPYVDRAGAGYSFGAAGPVGQRAGV